ncbi:MFS transporter [Neobacillus sp. C211]|uniref:MFS transporter n=1 Tax=unclassified Neobacillus TaxID=2675272 RepID=UPI0039794DA0
MSTVKKYNPWVVFFCLLISVFVLLEAAAFQSPALPFITKNFGINPGFGGAVTLAYYAAAVVFAPLMGRLSDQIGRKEMILVGLTIFSLSEFIAALSPNFSVFLAARFLQGMGYACVFPVIFAYISDLFKEESRGKAIGYLGATATIGAASGGIIAGVLIDQYGWSIIYWISGIFSAIGIGIIYFTMPKTTQRSGKQVIDFPGTIILLVTIGSLVTLPMMITNFGLASPISTSLIVSSVIGLIALILVERKAREPVMDIKILRLRGIRIPAVIVILQNFCNIALIYALTYYIAGREGWGATETGLMSTINYIFNSAATLATGYLVDKYKPRIFVVAGAVLSLGGAFAYTMISTTSSYAFLIFAVSIVGLCSGLINPALMKIVTTEVPKALRGAGSGTYVMFRDIGVPLGSSIGLALFGFMSRSGGANAEPIVATTNAINGVGTVVMCVIVVLILTSLLLYRKANSETQEEYVINSIQEQS